MIKEFRGLEGETTAQIESKLYLEVELVDNMKLNKPTVEIDIRNGVVLDISLLDGKEQQSYYNLSEVEKNQAMDHISKIPYNQISELLFG